jgi:hypothetical protein
MRKSLFFIAFTICLFVVLGCTKKSSTPLSSPEFSETYTVLPHPHDPKMSEKEFIKRYTVEGRISVEKDEPKKENNYQGEEARKKRQEKLQEEGRNKFAEFWDENITFAKCIQKNNYANIEEKQFLPSIEKEIEHLLEKLYNITPPVLISELCRTKNHSKIISIGYIGKLAVIFRYDSNKKIYEVAELKESKIQNLNIDNIVQQSSNIFVSPLTRNTGFQKKTGEIIPVIFSNLTLRSSLFNKMFTKTNNKNFCTYNNCTFDIYYDYNFVTNEIFEQKVCAFYLDENNKRQQLEKCATIS